MRNQEIRFKNLINDEVGLGRNRSELTGDVIPGSPKEPPITMEEEAILDELGLGRNLSFEDPAEQNKANVDKQ